MVDFSMWDILRNLLLAARWTVGLSLIAFIGGGLVGMLLLLLRLGKLPGANALVSAYVQLFLAYYGLGLFGINTSPWVAAGLGLTLYASAFLTEIWRGCVAAIPLLHSKPAAMRELRQRVGMVFQSFNLFPHLTVGKNIMLAPGLVKNASAAGNEAHARELLERVGLAEKFEAYGDQLPGGQQQRVAIARALAMEPAALLCDEVTSALDPELVGEVLRVVERLAEDGMTLLMVTHEMNYARKVADRVVFMHQGLVHKTGAPAELFGNPRTPELQQFLGALVN